MRELKIGTSSVRGVVGEALTPELVVDFACALGTWADGRPVVIGRDPRHSSSMLRSAVVAGLLSTTSEVIDLDICPTPLISFAVRELGASAGISITGSHNDFFWNALKFIADDGTLLNAVKSEELLDIYHASANARIAPGQHSKVTRLDWRNDREGSQQSLGERFLEHTLFTLDTAAIKARKLRVAVDFCNGAAGEVVTPLLERLGCSVIPINEKPEPRFAHAPAPTPKNMRELAGLVRHLDVDFGVAVNVDGDRVALALPSGEALSEEFTLPLATLGRLSRRRGPVVTNLSTSRMVDSVAEAHGQTVTRTAVGEGHVLDCGIEQDAVIAGEGSGGVAILPTTMVFDGGLTIATIADALVQADKPLTQLVADLPSLTIRKGQLLSSPERLYRVMEHFRGVFADQKLDVSDGLRVDWPDSWMHIRASITEPIVRVIVEAESEARAEALFEEAMTEGQRAVILSREQLQ